ncbi:MAG: pyridoxamine 5'-phosphate oxidase [Ekhidna sp.]
MRADVASLRNEYSKMGLDEKSCEKNPFNQFEIWFNEALEANILEPNAMALSTASLEGRPTQRTVLLKDFSKTGFTFYTNYTSSKAKEIAINDHVSILFPWYSLERQIIINGNAAKVSREKSAEYFHSRPRGSQIGAHVSNQSEILDDRSILEKKLEELENKFEDKEIPLPDNWGGYEIIPNRFEFWQGRKSRLHDRIQYTLEHNDWNIRRLSP